MKLRLASYGAVALLMTAIVGAAGSSSAVADSAMRGDRDGLRDLLKLYLTAEEQAHFWPHFDRLGEELIHAGPLVEATPTDTIMMPVDLDDELIDRPLALASAPRELVLQLERHAEEDVALLARTAALSAGALVGDGEAGRENAH